MSISYLPAVLDANIDAYLTKLQQSLDEFNVTQTSDEQYSDPNDGDGHNPSPVTLLARNALKELSPRLPELTRNGAASRLLEELIVRAGSPASIMLLDTLLEAGSRQFASLTMHPSASHFLQTCITTASYTGVPAALPQIISSWSYDLLIQVMSSSAGTHVFRAAISLLVRVPAEEPTCARLRDDVPPSTRYFDNVSNKPDEAAITAVTIISETLLQHQNDLPQLLQAPQSCGAIQALLTALAVCNVSKAAEFATSVLPPSSFDDAIVHRVASRFIDRMILTCGWQIVDDHFRDNETLTRYTFHPTANFCVQRYIALLTSRPEVARVIRVLEPTIDSLLSPSTPRDGVVLALARAAEYHGDIHTQSLLARAIASGAGAIDKDARYLAGHLAMRGKALWGEWCRRVDEKGMAALFTEVKRTKQKALTLPQTLPRASLLGTLIARALMRFPGGAGQGARASLSSLSNTILLALSADPVGNRLVEQWLLDPVPKRAEKIAGKLLSLFIDNAQSAGKGTFGAVCRNANAGMLVIKSMERANAGLRRKVMENLAGIVDELLADRFGQVVIRKCRVRRFMKRNSQWEHETNAIETKQRLFADIFRDDQDLEIKENLKGKKKRKRSDLPETDSIKKIKESKRDKTQTPALETGGDCTEEGGNGQNLTSVISAIQTAANSVDGKKMKKKKKKQKNISTID